VTPSGSIPVLFARGRSLPEAYENALLTLYEDGCRIRTQYDKKDADGAFIDPPSIDATMTIVVEEPNSEPRFSRCFPGGPEDLQEYRMEVVDGVKDHWVDHRDKKKWQYTYHERLTAYDIVGGPGGSGLRRNQIDAVVEQLAKTPYSRRIQAITWQPWIDQDCDDPPCLQRLWFRILEDDAGIWRLNMNVDFRSRDAFKASFMNMDVFIYWMTIIAERVSKRAGRQVLLGRYCDTSASFHIYGKDLEEFSKLFLWNYFHRSFDDRTYTTEDLAQMMAEAVPAILAKIKAKDEGDRDA